MHRSWTVSRDVLRCLWLGLGVDARRMFETAPEISRWTCARCRLWIHLPAVAGDSAFYESLLAKHWYSVPGKFEHREALRILRRRFSSSNPDLESTVPPPSSRRWRALDRGAGRCPLPATSWLTVETREPPVSKPPFDVVCAFQVLEHVASPIRFLAECVDWVRPGGFVVVGVPAADSYLARMCSLPLDLPPHHVTGWTERALETALLRVGLVPEPCRRAPEESWERGLAWSARVFPDPPGPPSCWRGLIRALTVSLGALVVAPRVPSDRTGSTLLFTARRLITKE
ncbi:MAG: class I SAM-dependent methyltransferase [Myxococcota bacterium]